MFLDDSEGGPSFGVKSARMRIVDELGYGVSIGARSDLRVGECHLGLIEVVEERGDWRTGEAMGGTGAARALSGCERGSMRREADEGERSIEWRTGLSARESRLRDVERSKGRQRT